MIIPIPMVMTITYRGNSGSPDDIFKFLLTIWIVCNIIVIITWIARIVLYSIIDYYKKQFTLMEYVFSSCGLEFIVPLVNNTLFFTNNGVAVVVLLGKFIFGSL